MRDDCVLYKPLGCWWYTIFYHKNNKTNPYKTLIQQYSGTIKLRSYKRVSWKLYTESLKY